MWASLALKPTALREQCDSQSPVLRGYIPDRKDSVLSPETMVRHNSTKFSCPFPRDFVSYIISGLPQRHFLP